MKKMKKTSIFIVLALTLLYTLLSQPEFAPLYKDANSVLGFVGNLKKIESDDTSHLNPENPGTNLQAKLQAKLKTLALAPHAPKNFIEAKIQAKKIYSDHRATFYCGCQFDKYGKIDLKSCGYKVQKDFQRANRLEWEHIVPVSQIACHLPCWQQKECKKNNGKPCRGRECCRENDSLFSIIEADLHNLVPEVGELNACRSNFRFGVLPYIQPGQFGECHFKVDKENRRVEPKQELRGMIARIYFYVADRYGVQLSDSQLQLFQAWNKEFPPDAWEIERDNRIAKIQGNHNPFISDYN
jgi:deoxyribonuclease-1